MFWVLDVAAGLFIFGVQPGTTPGKDWVGVGRGVGWGEERWGCLSSFSTGPGPVPVMSIVGVWTHCLF